MLRSGPGAARCPGPCIWWNPAGFSLPGRKRFPVQAELQQVLAQPVGVIDHRALGARAVIELAARLGQRVRFPAHADDGFQLHAVEQVQRVGRAVGQHGVQADLAAVVARRAATASAGAGSRRRPAQPECVRRRPASPAVSRWPTGRGSYRSIWPRPTWRISDSASAPRREADHGAGFLGGSHQQVMIDVGLDVLGSLRQAGQRHRTRG